jgi:hypothetical protein
MFVTVILKIIKMDQKKSKSIQQIIRSLHRDIGFFIVGLTIIFSLSGIVLVFRDTEFLKRETTQQRELKPDLSSSQLGEMLRIKDFKVIKEEGDVITFQVGTYNKVTGDAEVTMKTAIFPLNKFVDLHKTFTKKSTNYFVIIFGILLCFMAISSFWMYKPTNKNFKRGSIFAATGVLSVILLLIIS